MNHSKSSNTLATLTDVSKMFRSRSQSRHQFSVILQLFSLSNICIAALVSFFTQHVLSEPAWAWVEGDIKGPNLGPRIGSSIVQSANKRDLWLFGGLAPNEQDGTNTSSLWKLDVKNNYTWIPITTNGASPTLRTQSLVWVDKNDNLFVYGGYLQGNPTQISSDFWTYNITANEWRLLRKESVTVRGDLGFGNFTTYPGPRAASCAWFEVQDELWLYGGTVAYLDTRRSAADVWKYSIRSDTWIWMSGQTGENVLPMNEVGLRVPSNTAFPGSFNEGGCTKDMNGNVWFFGSTADTNIEGNQLWKFHPASLNWTFVDGTVIVQNGTWVQGRYGWQGTIGEYNWLNYPPYSYYNTIVYSGDNIITLFTKDSAVWSYNITINQWATIIRSGNIIYQDYNPAASRSKFQRISASNTPGSRTQYGYPRTLGSLWIVRGNATADGNFPADTFVYSIDICGSDLAPSCGLGAICIDKIGYAECQCKDGYEADGVTCQVPSAPVNKSPQVILAMDEMTQKVVLGVLLPVGVLSIAIPIFVVLLKRYRAKKNHSKNHEERSSTTYLNMSGVSINTSSTDVPLSNFTQSQSGAETMDQMNIPYSEVQIRHEIGAGAYGKVFVGEWQMTTVAMKISGYSSSEEFLREAALLIKLRPHPNVVQVLGVSKSTDGVNTIMIMEYCDGGSLDKVLAKSNVTFETKLHYLSGIAKGVYHLHKNKIIHRDLAARNILLLRGEPKISDFGLSRKIEDPTKNTGKTKSTVGPLRWMAPESIATTEYSVKTDAWSFGMLCWEVMAEEEPYHKSQADQLDLAIAIRDQGVTPSIDDKWNKEIVKLMQDCWSINPKARPVR